METLITLPYAPDALAPVLSTETISTHHGKHLAGYVKNLNAAIKDTSWEDLPLEQIMYRAAAENKKSIFLNHNMYFQQFTPSPSRNEPQGELRKEIDKRFGSFDAFKKDFVEAGVALFGSGWVWLKANFDGKLTISQFNLAGNPVVVRERPILTFDVWEHAYYLDYQNRRADYLYLNALWDIIDWKTIENRYTK